MDATDRRKRASCEAAEWWVRLQSAEQMTHAEREDYVDWLRESPIHVAEMLRIAQVHDALDQFERWTRISSEGAEEVDNVVELPDAMGDAERKAILGAGVADGRVTLTKSSSTTRRRGRLALAASVAALGLVVVWLIVGLRPQTIETERGERREVALSDGSVVDVDPETRLRARFDEHARRVTLEKGRALFRVAKNPDRPFFVEAEGTTVKAVGTTFGVEQQNAGVVVTVSEGKVAVSSSATPRLPSMTPGPVGSDPHGASALFLTAGQQVTVSPSGSAKPVKAVDSDRELAWAKGRLVFDNEPLEDAVAEFNRYNRVQLHVVDSALARRPVSAVFDAEDPESFVAFIQSVAPVRVIRGDSTDITISTL